MLSRRFFVMVAVVGLLGGCPSAESPVERLSIGVVSYGEAQRSVEQYAEFKTYLGQQVKSLLELEPTYNELKAVRQIDEKIWDIVFAPPGLAAIAISKSDYIPLFPLEGTLENRSVLVVLRDSAMTKISDLNGKTLGLGQVGSATGYYLPIYNLYGLTLKEIRSAATPKQLLELIYKQEVDAGAMSLAEFNQYRSNFPSNHFRVLYTDSHEVPSGSVLVSSKLNSSQQEQIKKALQDVSPAIASSAGYIPNVSPPKYDYLIEVVERVRKISERIKQKPAPLY